MPETKVVQSVGPSKPEVEVNWTDITKFYDDLRALASERNKKKEKNLKMIHKVYLEKQIEDNKVKKIQQFLKEEKDGWNTIEMKGYNDKVLQRYPPPQKEKLVSSTIVKSKSPNQAITPPEWSDPAIKYIKKDVESRVNKSVDNVSSNKHFLYPLLNKTKRKQFKKMMEINCKVFNEKQLQRRQSEDKIGDFEKKYNKKLIKMLKSNIQESSENINLAGTVPGDERLHKQLKKFIEKDK